MHYLILGLIDLFSGPISSLIYPMWCTYEAIENGKSATEIRPLLTYWVFYSIFATFEEIAIYPFIDWIPWWYLVKLVFNVAMIIPHFKGSVASYDNMKPWIDRHVQNFSLSTPYFKNLFNEISETLSSTWRSINATASGYLGLGRLGQQPHNTGNTDDNIGGPAGSESTSNNYRSNGDGYRLRTVTPTTHTFH